MAAHFVQVTTKDEFFYPVDSSVITITANYPDNKASHFSVEKPKTNRITKAHTVSIDSIHMTKGFYNLTVNDYIQWFINIEGSKKYELLGTVFVPAQYFATDIDLINAINNRIHQIYIENVVNVLPSADHNLVPYFVKTKDGEIRYIHEYAGRDGFLIHNHIYFGPYIARLMGYQPVNVDQIDFFQKPIVYPSNPKIDLSCPYDKIILKCNFAQGDLYTDVPNYKDIIPLGFGKSHSKLQVTDDEVGELTFWFENEHGQKISNSTGITNLLLHFKKE